MSGEQLVFWQWIVVPLVGIVVTLGLAWRTRRFLARAARAPGKITRVTEEQTEQCPGRSG